MVTCKANDQGVRVVMGRHLDTCPGDCPGCQPCAEPHCSTCRQEHAEGTCPGCLAMARGHLDAVVELAAQLGGEATEGRGALHTHGGVPGGDALVLLAPGHYQPGDPPGVEDQANDPRPPLAVLRYWTDTWSQLQGYAPAPTTLGDVASYLDGQLHHIGVHRHTFPKLARDLARTVRQLEDVLLAGVRPETSRVPCWECGVRLVKRYASQERDDHWVCPRCGEVYDKGRYDRAKHDHLASTGAERYVTATDAIAAIGRPEQTVRSWIRKDLVTTRRDPATGRLLVWWPDVRQLHLDTPTRARQAAG